MEAQFSTLGALIGLAIAILLIIRKIAPAYCLILGALIGGLVGGGGLVTTLLRILLDTSANVNSPSLLLLGEGESVETNWN